MSESKISAILNGWRVLAYDVPVRVAQGLGVPRASMGLAYSGGVEGARWS